MKAALVTGGATVLAAIIGGLYLLASRGPSTTLPQKFTNAAMGTPADHAPMLKNKFISLSFDEVSRTLSNEDLTDLQKTQFAERNGGERVQWQGIVGNVQRESEADAKSNVFVVFTNGAHPLKSSDYAICSFPNSRENEAMQLSKGDAVDVSGTLSFSRLALDYSANLNDCELINFSKPASILQPTQSRDNAGH